MYYFKYAWLVAYVMYLEDSSKPKPKGEGNLKDHETRLRELRIKVGEAKVGKHGIRVD